MGSDISRETSRREEAARSGQHTYPRHTATYNQQSRPANSQPSRPANTQQNTQPNTQPSRPANTQQFAARTAREPGVEFIVNQHFDRDMNNLVYAMASQAAATTGSTQTDTAVPGSSGGGNETITQAQTPSTKYNYSKDKLLAMNRMSLYPNLNDGSTTSPKTTTNTQTPNNDVNGRTAQQNYPQTASRDVGNAGGHYSRASRIINGAPASDVNGPANDYVFVNRNIRHESRSQSATARGPRPASAASDRHRCACGCIFSAEIFQCGKGHSACVECRDGGAGCRECGARVLAMRNYALEAVIRDEGATASRSGSATASRSGSATASRSGSATASRSGSATGSRSGAPDDYSCACGRAFGEEIYQCGNGHSACDECRSDGAGCRDCGMRVLDMRNFQLEARVSELKMDCPNTEMGCKMRLRRQGMESHLRECIYREMDCPLAAVYGRCTWRGRRGVEMVRHFDERHAGARRVGVGEEAALFRLHLDERIVHLALFHNYFFIVHVKVSEADQTLRMAVQLLGTKVGATKWMYEFHIYNKAEPRRKFTYADICTPDGDRIDDVFAECRCLVMPLGYARGFMAGRGLNYKFFVTKTGEDGRPQRPRQRAHASRDNSRGRNKKF